MNISNITNKNFIDPVFFDLPEETQNEELALFARVNKNHLHCEEEESWQKVHKFFTHLSFYYHEAKKAKQTEDQKVKDCAKQAKITPPMHDQAPVFNNEEYLKKRTAVGCLSPQGSFKCVSEVKKRFEEVFYDSQFVEALSSAHIEHILSPLQGNAQLAVALSNWIGYNVMFLPLGAHLLEAFKEDMANESTFAKSLLAMNNFIFIPEASSDAAVEKMRAFLTEAGRAHWRSCENVAPRPEKSTAVIISVKDGAGGHTSPHNAMGARLKESGWDVHFVYYDTDLPEHNDSFKILGITFEDNTEMTRDLFATRWVMQKQNKDVSRVINWYVQFYESTYPDLFCNNMGADLITRKIVPINPHLIITSCAYHWSWQSLAYRVPTAKTLLVASDVFFHYQASKTWQRQRSKGFPVEFRNVHFTAMTDDLELLNSLHHFHDEFYKQKYPDKPFESWKTLELGFHLDEQISAIGAPINPAFKVPALDELPALREKWNIPDGAVSICLSRGKLGYDSDLKPALESYRSDKPFAKKVIINVVCGENARLYRQLKEGLFNDLASNLTVIPHALLPPSSFAELRSISLVDDIKAGGGSTFEGWYMISQGIESMLFLTPGKELWWENANCQAMEKWGVGKTFLPDTNKTTILNQLLEGKLSRLSNKFKDWRPAFDAVTSMLKTKALR